MHGFEVPFILGYSRRRSERKRVELLSDPPTKEART